jgi:hypothetical protein
VNDLFPSHWRFRIRWETFDSFRIWTHVYQYGFNEISGKRIFRMPNNEHRWSVCDVKCSRILIQSSLNGKIKLYALPFTIANNVHCLIVKKVRCKMFKQYCVDTNRTGEREWPLPVALAFLAIRWETFDSFRIWTHVHRYGLNKSKSQQFLDSEQWTLLINVRCKYEKNVLLHQYNI